MNRQRRHWGSRSSEISQPSVPTDRIPDFHSIVLQHPLQRRGGRAAAGVVSVINAPRSGSLLLQIPLDCLEHPVEILLQLPILKSDHRQPLFFQKLRSPVLIHIDVMREVRLPVEFDHKSAIWTIEVDNVATDADLSPKFVSEQLAVLKRLPENSFRRSQGVTKRLSKSFLRRVIDFHRTHGSWRAVGEPKRWLRDFTNHPGR